MNDYLKDIKTLRSWAKAYYLNDDPIATDQEYDILLRKTTKYEEKNEIINPLSPTQFVGWEEE